MGQLLAMGLMQGDTQTLEMTMAILISTASRIFAVPVL
jgi:hypothetical protein